VSTRGLISLVKFVVFLVEKITLGLGMSLASQYYTTTIPVQISLHACMLATQFSPVCLFLYQVLHMSAAIVPLISVYMSTGLFKVLSGHDICRLYMPTIACQIL
jgi:hypothetical protein